MEGRDLESLVVRARSAVEGAPLTRAAEDAGLSREACAEYLAAFAELHAAVASTSGSSDHVALARALEDELADLAQDLPPREPSVVVVRAIALGERVREASRVGLAAYPAALAWLLERVCHDGVGAALAPSLARHGLGSWAHLVPRGQSTPPHDAVLDLADGVVGLVEAYGSPDIDASPTQAFCLNLRAGHHGVTPDLRELRAAVRAGERSWFRVPYYALRYGHRGHDFVRSDSGWLALLTQGFHHLETEVRWLAGVLANRGMPSVLLVDHLGVLATELRSAVPERREAYDGLDAVAALLRAGLDRKVSPERTRLLARSFDVANEANETVPPGLGRLVVGAAVDEALGRRQAVPSFTRWALDEGRFDEGFRSAVITTLAATRAAAVAS